MNNSLQLKSKESIIQELVNSYKDINEAIPNLNRGGCGIFAECLYDKCKALGLDPKIMVETDSIDDMKLRIRMGEEAWMHRMRTDFLFSFFFQGNISHIRIRVGDKCIDSNSVVNFNDLLKGTVEVDLEKLLDWNANDFIWNRMFERNHRNIVGIETAINNAYEKINGRILVMKKKAKKNLEVKNNSLFLQK